MKFLKQTRPAVISALKKVDLVGRDGIISEFAPGVFVQVLFLVFCAFHHEDVCVCISVIILCILLAVSI